MAALRAIKFDRQQRRKAMNSKCVLGFAVCAAIALAISCGKKEEAAPPTQSEAPKSVTAPAVEAQKPVETKAVVAPAVEVQKAVETQAATVQQAVTTQAQSMTTQATDITKGVIEKAQALMADKKYADALSSLQSLAGQSLSVESKTLVDGLIKQAQQAIAAQTVSQMTGQASSQASTVIGNLLGSNKEAVIAPAPQAQSMTAQATDMAKSVIAKAQVLLADKKYADVISSLQSLAGQSLSPETKAMVDDLIKQAQQAMATQAANQAASQATSEATKALGNLFGGKK
ncbi:MAG: hypothetical protein WCV00_02885 [Verrucomicrobiia bacterium]